MFVIGISQCSGDLSGGYKNIDADEIKSLFCQGGGDPCGGGGTATAVATSLRFSAGLTSPLKVKKCLSPDQEHKKMSLSRSGRG